MSGTSGMLYDLDGNYTNLIVSIDNFDSAIDNMNISLTKLNTFRDELPDSIHTGINSLLIKLTDLYTSIMACISYNNNNCSSISNEIFSIHELLIIKNNMSEYSSNDL